ncbi:hypothetical protein [Methyloversatilis discipulorum]|uniref:hypothetical protein n=1 Tax=Methyloversatilis discipulorum TaxID=1119528 RepID=UPI000370880D|nr:hypothetical protein [Methyloversatilis discipulorum]
MSDIMKEAERLAQAYADAVLLGEGSDEALAALLAHIQRGVPEGNERDQWEAVVFTLMGHAASLYFLGQSDMPNWFYELAEKLARRHVDEALAARVREVGIQQRAALAPAPDQFRDAAKMMADPAEVPMPEEIGWVCWNGTRIGDGPPHFCTYEPTAHQLRERVTLLPAAISYGAAREAAGYARAANWLRASAEKHAGENGYHEHDTGSFVFASREAEEWNNSVLELADEMEAALRGEVKP